LVLGFWEIALGRDLSLIVEVESTADFGVEDSDDSRGVSTDSSTAGPGEGRNIGYPGSYLGTW
jgi:hypothetical protein